MHKSIVASTARSRLKTYVFKIVKINFLMECQI
jgi:hypothetical protein